MKVIGAGFGRTGTMSQKAALEQLGFGPSFHMIDIARQPELLPGWQAAVDGEAVDWKALLEGWESTVDWPACTFWEEIWAAFPDAKVLLSVRDPEAWYASCAKSIHASAQAAAKGELEGGSIEVSPEAMKMINGLIWNGTFKGRFDDKDFAIERLRGPQRGREEQGPGGPAARLRDQGGLGAAVRVPRRAGAGRPDAAPQRRQLVPGDGRAARARLAVAGASPDPHPSVIA